MKDLIEAELGILIKQPLIDIGRAGNLLWISFGKELFITDKNGCKKSKRKYALHIQCAWRIVNDSRIIVGSRDFYTPRTGLGNISFEWDNPGVNRFDEKIEELQDLSRSTIVEGVVADEFGGLKIIFDSGIRLEIFPDESLEDEFWRFIIAGETSKHFVVFDKD